MVLSSLFTGGPLFSTIITLYLLILLYFPNLFLGIIFSPILISTSLLLLSLLRLGAIQDKDKNKSNDPTPAENDVVVVLGDDCQRQRVSSKPDDSPVVGSGSCDNRDQGQFHGNAPFVEWDVRAPLEVIYEEYEGQLEEGDDVSEEKKDAHMATFERYASLSKFYPETDSDTSEEDDFPSIGGWDPSGNIGFRWEGEDRDGMIEIELYEKAYSDIEEENLIEIDLHPASSPSR